MSQKPVRSGSDTDAPSEASFRESQVRPREEHAEGQAELRRVRKRAVTLRNQGWNYEIQGRAAAFREAAQQVKKWLLDRGTPPTESEIRFVVKLLEQSAEVYEAAEK